MNVFVTVVMWRGINNFVSVYSSRTKAVKALEKEIGRRNRKLMFQAEYDNDDEASQKWSQNDYCGSAIYERAVQR